MNIRENVPIADLTTMRLGGNARYVAEIETKDDIEVADDFAQEHELPTFILGAGANTIGRDEGFDGVILLSRIRGIDLKEDDDTLLITGGSGETWDDIVALACERGYTGIEGLSGIPGTLGAAPVQNIGAYGQEISQTLDHIEVYDREYDQFKTLTPRDLNFGYRRSILNHEDKGQYFVISVTLRLKKGQISGPLYNSLQAYLDEQGITSRSPAVIRAAVLAVRASKLPDPAVQPSAGSFFKNVIVSKPEGTIAASKGIPVHDYDADHVKINSGWLIEHAGLKGELLHGMRISDKAALVLINESATSFRDLAEARTEIRQRVLEKFGFDLSQEPEELV